ncbi:hypothetical protein AMETH_3256 [Amycolatopsis methanolica 239]|uniref:Archease domain-containing protein n=1 Tax=Amycolatopsis methanolica 239 TaxID=1068978 RepID=A0A076MR35_AMYME|nr:hypothetical protein AMETH_3256 [Amycolatopsis methanolica 239]
MVRLPGAGCTVDHVGSRALADRDGRRPVHAADLRIRAWAACREACLAEAVEAMVRSFLGRVPRPSSDVRFSVSGGSDTDLLRALLTRAIDCIRVLNRIPVSVTVVPTATGLSVECATVDAGAVLPCGALPKRVSATGLRCEPASDGRWLATALIDV